MRITLPRWLLAALLVLAASLAGAAAYIGLGVYSVAADDPHGRLVHGFLQTVRERSISARVRDLAVPDLGDPAKIRQGAGNYDAMCVACHLAPDETGSELSEGLYPRPPNLTRETVEPAAAFWVIKHGIKATGMPAWGVSMADEYIWNLTAFVSRLPTLTAAEYRELVESSGGHAHGEPAHAHDDDPAGSGATVAKPDAASDERERGITHRHADGTVEKHPVR